MLQYIMAAILVVVGMARRRRRRRTDWTNYMNGTIDIAFAFGGLAVADVDSTPTQTTNDTVRVSSIRCTYSMSNFTAIANAGPILVGVAHSDYTAAEIELWIETSGTWDRGDLVVRETRSRRIRQIGVFDIPATIGETSRLNDGKPIRTKLNWLLPGGDGLQFWVYNQGQANVATTAPNLLVNGKANLWAQ